MQGLDCSRRQAARSLPGSSRLCRKILHVHLPRHALPVACLLERCLPPYWEQEEPYQEVDSERKASDFVKYRLKTRSRLHSHVIELRLYSRSSRVL